MGRSNQGKSKERLQIMKHFLKEHTIVSQEISRSGREGTGLIGDLMRATAFLVDSKVKLWRASMFGTNKDDDFFAVHLKDMNDVNECLLEPTKAIWFHSCDQQTDSLERKRTENITSLWGILVQSIQAFYTVPVTMRLFIPVTRNQSKLLSQYLAMTSLMGMIGQVDPSLLYISVDKF